MAPDQEERILILENHSQINRSRYFEAVRARENRINRVLGFLVSALLIWWALSARSVVLGGSGAALFVISGCLPTLLGEHEYKKLVEKNGKDTWGKIIRLWEDGIESISEDGYQSMYSYQNLKNVIETPDLFILQFGKAMPSMIVCKDGFSKDTSDLFLKVLTDMRGEHEIPVKKRLFHGETK